MDKADNKWGHVERTLVSQFFVSHPETIIIAYRFHQCSLKTHIRLIGILKVAALALFELHGLLAATAVSGREFSGNKHDIGSHAKLF